MKSTWKKACTAWLLVLCLCAWLLPVQAEEIQGTNLPLDILQTDTGGEVGATARLEFSLKDTFRESYLEYCLAVSKQGEKDILTYDNHDKNDTVELTLQRGLCYSLYVLISDGQGSRAFSGVLRPMEDGTLMIGGEEILYEPEEEKPRTRSAGLMPVVYESEPNSNYSNADIIRPDECMKGYLATFYDTDCFKIEASNLSDARGYTVQLAVPPGVDYDIRIYDQSNNWVAEGIGSGMNMSPSPPSPTGTITSPCPRSGDITRAIPISSAYRRRIPTPPWAGRICSRTRASITISPRVTNAQTGRTTMGSTLPTGCPVVLTVFQSIAPRMAGWCIKRMMLPVQATIFWWKPTTRILILVKSSE